MKVKDLYRQKPGTVIDEFTARLVKISPPKEPTAAQRKAGIHRQTVIGQGADGTEIRIVILKENLHLPTSEAGRLFHFKSTPDERGRMGGILTCEWQKEGEPEPDFYIEIGGRAHFYAVEEEGNRNRKQGPDPSLKKDSVDSGRQRTLPLKLNAEDGHFSPSVQDHVEFYCSIVDAMEKRLAGSAMFDSLLKDPTPMFASCTSIFIQCHQNGTFRRSWKPVSVSGGHDRSEEIGGSAEDDRPAVERLAEDGDVEAMWLVAVTDGNWDAAESLAASPKMDHVRAYDLLVDSLKHPRPVIDAAFDHIEKKFSLRGDAACRAIVQDAQYFLSVIEAAAAAAANRKSSAAKQPDPGPGPENVFSEDLLAN